MRTTRVAAVVAASLLLAPAAHARGARKSRVDKGGSADAAIAAGLDGLKRKEYTAAISNFQKAAKARGDGASYFLLGYAYYQRAFLSGIPETADKQDALETVNAYMTAIALDPSLERVAQPYKLWHSLALSYEALGSDEKAVDAYKKAVQAAPNNPMLPLYAARLRLKMGDVEKSVENLTLALARARQTRQDGPVLDVIKTSPLFAQLLASPAHARVLHGYDASIVVPTDVAATPAPQRRAPMNVRAETLGDAYGLRDSVRQTAAPVRPTLSQKDQGVMDQLAAAAEEYKFRRYRQSITAYGEVLLLNQDSGVLSPAQLAMVHERIGTAYNRLGQSNEAIRELQRSVQDMPFNTAAHYQLALAYSVAGLYRESLKALNETFKTSATPADLRRYMLLAKTDAELDPIRDLPGFASTVSEYSAKLSARGR